MQILQLSISATIENFITGVIFENLNSALRIIEFPFLLFYPTTPIQKFNNQIIHHRKFALFPGSTGKLF